MKPGLLMLPSAVSDSRVHNILPNKIDTDFQFSRASSATRVNHQGLIEEVGYFSSELVQNGNFSELGSEIIVNGDFATDSNWSLGTGWTINNGKLRANNVSLVNAFQAYVYTSGKTYKVTYTISDYVKGEVRFQLGGGGGTVNGAIRDANGTYTEYIVATNNHTSARFRGLSADGGFTASIDNVSVKQVDPNNYWVLGTGYSITDKISYDGSASTYSSAYQIVGSELGKKYSVKFDCIVTSGSVQFKMGSINADLAGQNITVSSTGSYSVELTAGGTQGDRVYIVANAGNFVGSFDNISAREIKGDKPRLDYEPLNPTCPHLLLEPQSTNLIPFSEDITTYSAINATVTSNAIKSPDGTINSDKVNFSVTSGFSRVLVSSSGNQTYSLYVKYDTLQHIMIYANGLNGGRHIDIKNRIIGNSLGTAYTCTIENVGNDWSRITMFGTSAIGTSLEIYASTGTSYNPITIEGSVYIWGVQGEATAYATSYIPTSGSTVTRVAETCNNAGNVDTFNSTEGVLYAEIAALSSSDSTNPNRNISISDGTSNNTAIFYYQSSTNRLSYIIIVGGSVVASGSVDTYTVTNFNKIALKWKQNDFSLYINGTEVFTDTSGSSYSPGTLNRVNFDGGSGGDDFYGKVKGLATYNRALTDNELYTITSTQYSAYSGMVAALGNYTIPC